MNNAIVNSNNNNNNDLNNNTDNNNGNSDNINKIILLIIKLRNINLNTQITNTTNKICQKYVFNDVICSNK